MLPVSRVVGFTANQSGEGGEENFLLYVARMHFGSPIS